VLVRRIRRAGVLRRRIWQRGLPAGVDGGGGGGAGGVASEQAWMVVADPAAWPFLFFLEKKFAECFLGTRQRLCRVHDKKHSPN